MQCTQCCVLCVLKFRVIEDQNVCNHIKSDKGSKSATLRSSHFYEFPFSQAERV